MKNLILQPGEEVAVVFRQALATLCLPVLIAIVLIILPFWYALRYALFQSYSGFLAVWVAIVCVLFLRRYYLWRREKYIVTTVRFVKAAHEGVFKHVVSETMLDRILNISYRTTGPWSMMAGFGDVDIQVVGRIEPIVAKSVHKPALVKEFLWRLHEAATQGKRAVSAEYLAEEFVKPNQPVR